MKNLKNLFPAHEIDRDKHLMYELNAKCTYCDKRNQTKVLAQMKMVLDRRPDLNRQVFDLYLNQVDLLENYHLLPDEVQRILLDFDEESNNLYQECKDTIAKLELHGYTADYDLSGEIFDLKKIK